MQHLLRTSGMTRAKRSRDDSGFTLIELLVVVVILGVLVGIAIPVYLSYRKGVNDSVAKSDVRNIISVLAVCNADNGAYPIQDFTWSSTSPLPPCSGQIGSLSAGTSMKYSSPTGADFILVGTNSGGSSKYYCYNSAKAGSVAPVTADNLAAATC